jgi:PHD/YefM family antitoxin component YafN of YafNO toxin-antitoxin module
MSIVTMTSREFNQATNEAKKAALEGPVFITDRGHPSHVLLNIDEYRRLVGKTTSLAEAMAQYDVSDVDFEPPRVRGLTRPTDLS